MSKSVAPAVVAPGDTVTYTITLTNSGNGITTVTLTDSLPSGFNPATYTQSGLAVPGRLPLAAGGTATTSFTATVPLTPGTYYNQAITATYNLTQATVGPSAPVWVVSAGITITKKANVNTANIGETITYTYIITNSGDITLTNINVTDSPLGALIPISTTLGRTKSTTGTATTVATEADLPGEEHTGPPDPTDSTDSTDSTEPSYIPVPDVPPPVTPCDPFAQDCPEGHKCVPYRNAEDGWWVGEKCVPVTGEQGVGEPCTYDGAVEATDDCDASSHCWDTMSVDGQMIGTCLAFCGGSVDAPECPPGSGCMISGDLIIALCKPSCDPLAQDCAEGLACFWAVGDFHCIFTTEDIPAGEPCAYINDCAPGLVCLNADVLPECAGSACCGAFCDLTLGDAQCQVAAPGTACLPFFEDPPPVYEDVGVCMLP